MIYVPIHGCANVEWKFFELSWVFHLNILLSKGRWSCLYGSSNQLWGGTLWKWALSRSYLEWKSKCESLILKIIQHEEEARKVAVWPRVWLSWHQPPSLPSPWIQVIQYIFHTILTHSFLQTRHRQYFFIQYIFYTILTHSFLLQPDRGQYFFTNSWSRA